LEYLIGAVVGVVAFIAFGVWAMKFSENQNTPAKAAQLAHAAAERAQRLRDEASLITARTSLRMIAERHVHEPMAGRIAAKAVNQINQLQGEPTILDELLKTKPKRTS
jgi:H+/gluconate symporter-like permease